MANSIKLEVPDAWILLDLWSLPTEGAARWIRKSKEFLSETLSIPISRRRFECFLGFAGERVADARENRMQREKSLRWICRIVDGSEENCDVPKRS
jgi:hypothetical protein